MKMRTPIVVAVLVAVIAAFLALLTRFLEPSTPENATTAIRSQTVLRVGLVSLPPGRGNPYSGTSVPTIYTHRAIFDGLTFLTEEGDVLPHLATSWTMIDKVTWQFHLREGVTFSNGTPFTAESVVFAVDYLTSEEGIIESAARELGSIASARVVDDHTVIISLKYPDPLLDAKVEQLLIVEPGQWQRLGRDGFAREPIGTGPFILDRWEGASAHLSAYMGSWRPPKVDKLEFIALPDPSSRVQGILAGRIDLAVSLSLDDARIIEAAGGVMDIGRISSTLGVVFLLTRLPDNHPLRDVRVRQALNYAVNKQAYVDALFGGFSRPASQPTTEASFGFNPELKPYPYDPQRAHSLLVDAGYPDGFDFTVEATIGGGASLAPAVERVASDLGRIGVQMTIRTIPVQQLIRGVQQGDWKGEAFIMNYSSSSSRDSLRTMRMHSCLWRAAWYCDEEITEKIRTALAEGDLEKRKRLTQEIMAYYRNNAPSIWMHEAVLFKAMSARVKNFRQDHAIINYHDIYLEDG